MTSSFSGAARDFLNNPLKEIPINFQRVCLAAPLIGLLPVYLLIKVIRSHFISESPRFLFNKKQLRMNLNGNGLKSVF